MLNLKTISSYLFRLYFEYFFAVFLIITGILIVSSGVDILQKFKDVNIPPGVFWKFALYKVPFLLNEIIVLIGFISMLFFWHRLVHYNELLVMLSSGIPLWRILSVAMMASFIVGVNTVMLINPIGTYGLDRYKQLSAKLTNTKRSGVTTISEGLLSFEEYENSRRLIQARSLDIDSKKLYDINIIFIGEDNSFLERMDAKVAEIENGVINLRSVKITTNQETKVKSSASIPTKLSIEDFKDSLVLPEVVSFWDLPPLITKLSASGVSVTNYQIYYYKQLFKPLVMVAMAVLASCFIRLNVRNRANITTLGIATVLGVVIYFILEIVIKILVYSGIAPIYGVLLPIFLIFFISNFLVLHLQEA